MNIGLFLFKTSFSVSFVSGILSQVGRDTGWGCTYEMTKSMHKGRLFKMKIKFFFKTYFNYYK